LSAWLDRLDDEFIRKQQWVFVTYDHLDKIGILAPRIRARYATTLLAMWLSLSNRFERLRSKIFLREDLFQVALRSSTDASKLETRSTSLRWSTEDLYRVLVRHLGASDGLRAWLGSGTKKIGLIPDPALGWMPPSAMPEDGPYSQRDFAEKLAVEWMGEGVKKGYTHRWIPNHVQDANGAIVPRSFLNLLAFAAQGALHHGPKAKWARLLHPSELQLALEKTSRYRATELQEEHPVVQRLEQLRGLTLFLPKGALVEALKARPPGSPDDGFGEDGDAVFEELVRLGGLNRRDEDRVDVPDIYRFGFGIKRKGGVARPR
jgi:hypothetical protein